MNVHAVRAIYHFEMARTRRTLMQSVISPVLSTSLYFVVFGAAIGSRIQEIGGISYGAFIVPGLVMLSLLTQSIANASFGIYFPKFTGTIYELLSAPVSYFEIVLSYVGAAATKSMILGIIIMATAALFVDGGPVFETQAGFAGSILARYTTQGSPLLSGYLIGDKYLSGKSAALDVPLESGHVVLLGFRPEWRGQPFGTFRVLFNALLNVH